MKKVWDKAGMRWLKYAKGLERPKDAKVKMRNVLKGGEEVQGKKGDESSKIIRFQRNGGWRQCD